ncbi:MAG TPA: hypothetical protein VGG64_16005 [Pirellulales bacterium]
MKKLAQSIIAMSETMNASSAKADGSHRPLQWSVRQMLVHVALICVYLAVIRFSPYVGGPLVTPLLALLWATLIVERLSSRRAAVVISIVVAVFSSALYCGLLSLLQSTEHTPPGTFWMSGGGLEQLLADAATGATSGLVIGGLVACLVYKWRLGNELIALNRAKR